MKKTFLMMFVLSAAAYADGTYTTNPNEYDVGITGGAVSVSTVLDDSNFASNKTGTLDERAKHWTDSTYANDGSIFIRHSSDNDITFTVDKSIYVYQVTFDNNAKGDHSSLVIEEGKTLQTQTGTTLSRNSVLTLKDGATLNLKGDLSFDSSDSDAGEVTLTLGKGATVAWGKEASIKFGANNDATINYGMLSTESDAAAKLTMQGVCQFGKSATFNAELNTEAVLAADDHTVSVKLIELLHCSDDRRTISMALDTVVHLTGWADDSYQGILTLSDGVYRDAAQNVIDFSTMTEPYYALVMSSDSRTLSLLAHAPEPATATLSLLALAGLASRRRRK